MQYSVGGIYLVIQNLPRDERFKEENVILIGCIPGPNEPHLSIDSYLLPLIEELKLAYAEGITVISSNNVSVKVRAVLSCHVQKSVVTETIIIGILPYTDP